MIHNADALLAEVRRLHDDIQGAVVAQAERHSLAALAAVAQDTAEGDTIFAIGRVSEQRLVAFFEAEVAPARPLVLIAEGLPDTGAGEGVSVLPRGAREEDAEVRILVDPIDGTRPYMYQKRSAWILTGVAPNRGRGTRPADIELAVPTEIPLVKQHLADPLSATPGAGIPAERRHRPPGHRVPPP